MKIKMAKKYGFCFGVKRAIKLAEAAPNSVTFGELIHNKKEIERLKNDFNVDLKHSVGEILGDGNCSCKSADCIADSNADSKNPSVIIRTHGIEKAHLEQLKKAGANIVDATCPFVTKPQEIVKEMSEKGYQVIIFGDENHPEVKGVKSYSATPAAVVRDISDLEKLAQNRALKKKVALISQTTKQVAVFTAMAAFLIERVAELRVFNTICNATFENQSAVAELSREVDIMIVVGGRASSNTKQLLEIAKQHCKDSYLVEDENDIDLGWFAGKSLCGITAGASTPEWIIDRIREIVDRV